MSLAFIDLAFLEDVRVATGHAQPQHEAVLGRRDVEEAEGLETIRVLGVGCFILVGVLEQPFPGIERILVVFPALLFAQVG